MDIVQSFPVQVSPFDSIRGYRADGTEFWTARELMKWLGYPRWQKGEIALQRAIKSLENQGYDAALQIIQVGNLVARPSRGNTEIKDYELSRFACYLVAMNADPSKKMVAMAQSYFAVKTREAEILIPAQSERIQELELELKLAESRERTFNLQNTMLTIHGQSVVLALAGKSDAIVREEIKVTEVLNLNTGSIDKFFGAEQLKVEVLKRSGQKLKTQKQFTDALRKANRDDLLVAVTRPVTSEYIHPDMLDEAISVVFGTVRQQLIGQ